MHWQNDMAGRLKYNPPKIIKKTAYAVILTTSHYIEIFFQSILIAIIPFHQQRFACGRHLKNYFFNPTKKSGKRVI